MAGQRWLLVAWVGLVAGAAALSALAARNETLPGDTDVLSWVQARAFPGEALSDVVQVLTMTEVVVGLGAAGSLALWAAGRSREAVALLAGTAALPLLQSGLKEVIDRPRPYPPLAELRAGYSSPSFPSGHVMSATFLYATALWWAIEGRLPRPARLPVGAWSALVLVVAPAPGVWLGVHWPSDVLGGLAWGLVLALPVAWWNGRERRR